MDTSEMIERLRRVPDSARQYRCDLRLAEQRFGLGGDVLRDLVERGLPHANDGELRFEHGDLHYLGVRLGTARRYIWGLTRWARSLESFTGEHRTAIRITDVPQIRPGAGAVDGIIHVAGRPPRPVTLKPGQAVAEVQGELIGQWPALPPTAGEVARRVADAVDFYLLPPSLRHDTELVRRIGLADCLSAAPLLVAEWKAAGFDARVNTGLLVSLPYSTIHSWSEVRVGATWVPADPLTIRLLSRFGGLDEGRWPPDRSSGSMLLPLSAPRPRITVNSGDIETTLMTLICPPPA